MTSFQRSCAFCDSVENLSREHVFPDGIIRQFKCEMLSLNDKSDYLFKSDLVVKDVCESCNNGALSSLDAKFIKLFNEYMLSTVKSGDGVDFNFDYHYLLRELLKISYNSSRASAAGENARLALRKFVPYILGNVDKAPGVMLRLQIVTSVPKINPETNQIEGHIDLNLLRSCSTTGPDPKYNYLVRLIAIKSFWFYLFIPLKTASPIVKAAMVASFKEITLIPGVALNEKMKSISIPKNKTTYFHPDLVSSMVRKDAK